MTPGFTKCRVCCSDPTHLVLQVRVGPSSKEKLYHFVVAIDATISQCCISILYGRMSESNHEMPVE